MTDVDLGLGRGASRVAIVLTVGTLVLSATAGRAQQPAPAAAAAQTVPQPAPPRAQPPFPNRLNEVLPTWLRVRGEFRGRMEGFEGAGFTSGRDDAYWLNRFRLNAAVQPTADLAFTVQGQDARVGRKTVGTTGPPFQDEFDLRLAYASLGGAQRPMTLTVGRQELVYGEQRLVGHLSWTNTARTFDAARATVRAPGFDVDVFGASVVNLRDHDFNKSGSGSYFYGAYGAAGALIPKSTIEPYVLVRDQRDLMSESGTLGDLAVATVGVRWLGTLPARLAYNTEMALQTGSLGPDDVRAWAGHWLLRGTLQQQLALRLIGEYNFASGDEDPTDGRRQTFDQLYPTGHDKYGLADRVGWRNIHHLRTGVELTPRRHLALNGSYHSWWLANANDFLYSAGGGRIAAVAGGASERHVGTELDAQAVFTVSPLVQVAGGYAHIRPGGFLKQATPGASYSAPYVMVTYVFLADR